MHVVIHTSLQSLSLVSLAKATCIVKLCNKLSSKLLDEMMKKAENILCFSGEPWPVTSQMKTFRDTKESFINIWWLNCNAAMIMRAVFSVENIEAASSLCHLTSRWWIQCSPFHVTYTASLTILKASYWHQLLTTEQKTFCNWELLSEFIDSPIDKQIYSNWELSSEHIDSIYFLVSLATVAMVKFNQLMEIIPYY